MANLNTLPTEILLQISTYLQPSAHLSLKLAAKDFFFRLPGVPDGCFKSCSTCEQKASKRFIHEAELHRRCQRRCVLCGGIQSSDFFVGPIPVCKWHEAWFQHRCLPSEVELSVWSALDERLQTKSASRFVAVKRLYCVHERDIIGSHRLECFCECDSCGHFEITCFFLVAPDNGQPVPLGFSTDGINNFCALEQRSPRHGVHSAGPLSCSSAHDSKRGAADDLRSLRTLPTIEAGKLT